MGLSDYLGRFWHSSEPMFGVIMVICFTSILRTNVAIAESMVWRIIDAALACCIAWGLVDGIFYAWELNYDRKKMERLVALSKSQANEESALSLLDENLTDTIIGTLNDHDRAHLYSRLLERIRDVDVGRVPLKNSVITVLITFCLVVGTAVIVLSPFALIPQVSTALLLSNALGIALLFFVGYWREEGLQLRMKFRSGIMTALVALIITIVTVYLGG